MYKYIFASDQTVAEREQDVKRLQDQLNEAKQNNEAGSAVQMNQNQSDPAAGDSNDEMEKLKQEVTRIDRAAGWNISLLVSVG